MAVAASGIRHEHFLCRIRGPGAGEGAVVWLGLGADGYAGITGGGRTLSGNAAGAVAPNAGVHLARIAVKGIFLFRSGGPQSDVGFLGLRGGILLDREKIRSLGPARYHLYKFREHAVPVDFRRSDRVTRVHQ